MISKYNGFIIEGIKNELVLILEADLYATNTFLSKLKVISNAKGNVGEMANLVYRIIHHNHYVNDDLTQNFIDVTDKSDTISFLPNGKMKDDWDQDEEYSLPFTMKGRSEMKIGRLIRRIIDVYKSDNDLDFKITDKDYEDFVNQYKSILDKDSIKFKLVDGDDINYYYSEKNYFSRSKGSLGGSCMSSEKSKTFDLYTKNPDKVRLLIYVDDDNLIHGRALVWKLKNSPCEAKYFMDRVYVNSDSDELKFIRFADDKGWLYKAKMNSENENAVKFIYNKKEIFGGISVKLDASHKKYPFVDTLCFVSDDFKLISNLPSKDCKITQSVWGDIETCSSCDGYVYEGYCNDCDGDGDTDNGKCVTCNGTGVDFGNLCTSCASGHILLKEHGVPTKYNGLSS